MILAEAITAVRQHTPVTAEEAGIQYTGHLATVSVDETHALVYTDSGLELWVPLRFISSAASLSRAQHEFSAKHPHPGIDPVKRLKHTLDMFDGDTIDGAWAIRATSNMYSKGEVTGLTWGDLKALLARLEDNENG